MYVDVAFVFVYFTNSTNRLCWYIAQLYQCLSICKAIFSWRTPRVTRSVYTHKSKTTKILHTYTTRLKTHQLKQFLCPECFSFISFRKDLKSRWNKQSLWHQMVQLLHTKPNLTKLIDSLPPAKWRGASHLFGVWCRPRHWRGRFGGWGKEYATKWLD